MKRRQRFSDGALALAAPIEVRRVDVVEARVDGVLQEGAVRRGVVEAVRAQPDAFDLPVADLHVPRLPRGRQLTQRSHLDALRRDGHEVVAGDEGALDLALVFQPRDLGEALFGID